MATSSHTAAGVAIGISSAIAISAIIYSGWKYRFSQRQVDEMTADERQRQDSHEHLPRHRSTLILPNSKHLAAKITPFIGTDHGAGETVRYGFAHTPGTNMRIASRSSFGGWTFQSTASNRMTVYDAEGIHDPEPRPSMQSSAAHSMRGNFTQSDVASYLQHGPNPLNVSTTSLTALVPPSPAYSPNSSIFPLQTPISAGDDPFFSGNPFDSLSERTNAPLRPLVRQKSQSIGFRVPGYHPDLDKD